MKILDWKQLASSIKEDLKNIIISNNIKPKLAIIHVWDSQASDVYVRNKIKACDYIWVQTELIKFSDNVTQDDLIKRIHDLNNDSWVTGLIVQLPLPDHIFVPEIIKAIDPKKDVDGFTAYNIWKMFASKDFEDLPPATPAWIIKILDEYQIDVKWMNAVVIGHSNIVWKPISTMLLNRDATVSTCHIHTKNLKYYTSNADLIISAAWVVNLVTEDMVKDWAVVIDVWINRNEDGKICWDVDFENVAPKCSYITPVPWGVWPMTIAQLLVNLVRAALS